MTPLQQTFDLCRARVENALDAVLPDPALLPRRLHEAMRYAVLGPGKRLRPLLVYQGGQVFGINDERLDPPACAVELIHAYSLVHDDLPAMDDDDLRRGRPTCHRAYDEATAILVGDALQTLAFRLIAAAETPESHQRLAMIETLAAACGSRGMAGGQAMDLAAAGQRINVAELEDMHIHKTGALILASLRLGALCATHTERASLASLERYGRCIGLAFQVQDDILDVTGTSALTGKSSGADARREKSTYPGLMGLAEARRFATELRDEAVESLAPFGDRADTLRALADYIVERDH